MLTKEQEELFECLLKDRKQIADSLEKQSMRGVKNSIVYKYSDQAHFIYELLQNADDVKATSARFILNDEGLIFAHNGKIHFSLSDPAKEEEDTSNKQLGHINSITSIGNSNKCEYQIGKFGVGFKAVFQYTDIPEIYDTPFLFKIERFIVPVLLEEDHSERKPDETLFYFPFTKPSEAFKDIFEKLNGLSNPLLFLRNLNTITWEANNGQHRIYSKDVKIVKELDSIKVEQIQLGENDSTDKQVFLIFLNETQHPELSSNLTYSIAYMMKEGNISDMQKFSAYCFFPTKETTNLHFIVQAPFLLTDSREGIKEKDSWNKHLIQCIAQLTAESISICKSIDMLNEEFFNVLPTDSNDFSEEHLFKPVYDEVLKKLQSDECLLPAKEGTFVSKKDSYLAENQNLMNLLDQKQLAKIVGNENAQWVFPNITDNSKIWKYVEYNLTANEKSIRPEYFAAQINENFMKKQSDSWLIDSFYPYLKNIPSLWNKNNHYSLRTKPIIRLIDDSMVSPFDSLHEEPQAYLPKEGGSEYPTVKKCFVDNEESLDFLKALGLKQPDEYAEIEHFILPRYGKEKSLDASVILKDFKKLFSYSKNCPAGKEQDYINQIKELSFIQAIYHEDNGSYVLKPERVYFRTDPLERYFDSFKEKELPAVLPQ